MVSLPNILFLGGGIIVSCEETKQEIILTAGDIDGGPSPGTTDTNDTDTKGATNLVLIRDIRAKTFTAPTESVIVGTVNNIANSIDVNTASNTTFTDSASTTNALARYDFGSVDTRLFAMIHLLNGSGGGGARTFKWRANTDGDTPTPTAWTPFVTVASAGSVTLAKALFIADVTVSCRHFEVEYQCTSATTTSGFAYEVWDAKLGGWGFFDTKFEVFDSARSDWKEILSFSQLTMENGDVTDLTQIGIMPYKATGLFRVSWTTTGLFNSSINLLKVKPCTT